MGGKGELVKYTRLFAEGPLTPEKKKKLIEDVTKLINAASNSITAVVLAEPTTPELKKAVDDAEAKKSGGKY